MGDRESSNYLLTNHSSHRTRRSIILSYLLLKKCNKNLSKRVCAARGYLLVPTLWFGAMSMVSVAESWRTARPRSAMQQVPFFFTRMFFDFKSLWAIAGFPGGRTSYIQQEPCINRTFIKNWLSCIVGKVGSRLDRKSVV